MEHWRWRGAAPGNEAPRYELRTDFRRPAYSQCHLAITGSDRIRPDRQDPESKRKLLQRARLPAERDRRQAPQHVLRPGLQRLAGISQFLGQPWPRRLCFSRFQTHRQERSECLDSGKLQSRSKSGKPYKVVKFASDITAAYTKSVEDAGKLDALSQSQAIIEFTPTGEILVANENFCNALGYSLSEIVGKHHSMFCDPAYSRSEEYANFWRRLAVASLLPTSSSASARVVAKSGFRPPTIRSSMPTGRSSRSSNLRRMSPAA